MLRSRRSAPNAFVVDLWMVKLLGRRFAIKVSDLVRDVEILLGRKRLAADDLA